MNLAAAAERLWDVAVVGAGPAGALATLELARRGHSVLLIEKASWPRWKVCGSCLGGRALAVLDAAGLAGLPDALGAVPLHQFCLAAGGRSAHVALPAGAAVSRSAFDAALVQVATESGATFFSETQAALASVSRDSRQLRLTQRSQSAEIHARVVLAAGGLSGALLPATKVAPHSRIGLGVLLSEAPPEYEPGTVYMACGERGYLGVVRVEGGQLDVAAAVEPDAVPGAGGPGRLAASLLQGAGLPPIPRLLESAWRGTPPLTRRAGRVAAYRLFVLGDAAGYVEPFTGEGIGWALAAAEAVVPFASQGVRCWDGSLEAAWTQDSARRARRQALCRATALLLRRPTLTRTLITALAAAPGLAAPFIRFLNRGPARWELHHESRHHGVGNRAAGPPNFSREGRGRRSPARLSHDRAGRRPGETVPAIGH